MKYWAHGGGDFAERLHDVLYDRAMKLALFAESCALELYGTIKPQDFPPINGRIVKALRYLGFDVSIVDSAGRLHIDKSAAFDAG